MIDGWNCPNMNVTGNCHNMNVTGLQWWSVTIGSGNGLVPSGNKPLPEPMLTPISVVKWCQNESIPWLLMLGFLPRHIINSTVTDFMIYGSLPSVRKDFNYLHHLSIKKWQKIMIANKLYIIYFLHPILFTYKSTKTNHQWIIRHCRQRWLFIVMSPQLICDVMPTCIVTSYSSMVLTCANWHKVDLH